MVVYNVPMHANMSKTLGLRPLTHSVVEDVLSLHEAFHLTLSTKKETNKNCNALSKLIPELLEHAPNIL